MPPLPRQHGRGQHVLRRPVAGAPLRLRIDFSRTIHADTYGGLRLAVVHPDRGEIDAVALDFVDHGTFHRRDEARNTSVNSKHYGTFATYRRPGKPVGAWAEPAPPRTTTGPLPVAPPPKGFGLGRSL